jgi:hypothetical protein
MTNSNRYPSYTECVAGILSRSPEPMTIETLVAQVETLRPLSKSGRSAILRAVDELYQAVPVEPARVGWLSQLLTGATIRHTMQGDESRRGYILLDELEHAVLFPEFFQDHEADGRVLTVELLGGETIQAVASAEHDVWALRIGAPMAEWLDDSGANPTDDLILQVIDAVEGRYLLRLQPREIRDEEAIEARNRALAQAADAIAEELLRRRPVLYTWEVVARLIGRGLFADALPPDDMHFVLNEYSRLHLVEGESYELTLGERGPRPLQTGKRVVTPPAPGRRLLFDSTSRTQGEIMDDPKREDTDEDTCGAYEEYLESFRGAHRTGQPLAHDDFHLYEAELENLVDLELEFGYLLPDQNARKQELAERLFIDPESLVDGGWDDGDDFDADSPGFWN